MEYKEFLETKKKSFIESGFDINEDKLNPKLKDFQKYCIKIAIKKGRFALFEDCGLGKTFQQLEWAKQVNSKTNKPVLILAPLAVVAQTIKEGTKFGIDIELLNTNNPIGSLTGIYISNYEQLKNIDTSMFIKPNNKHL
jgi:reverse gyrase